MVGPLVMRTTGVVHLRCPHFAAINLAVLVAIQCSEFFLALVFNFRKRDLAIAIDIKPTLHAVCCTAHNALLCQCFDFSSGKYAVTIGICSLEIMMRENFSRSTGPRLPFMSLFGATAISVAGLSVFALLFSCANAGATRKDDAITAINAVLDFMAISLHYSYTGRRLMACE
jgi:hypothetical protein